MHHRTYERLGRERPADLTVLCESCHQRYHGVMPEAPATSAWQRTLPQATDPYRAERLLLILMLRFPHLDVSRVHPGCFREVVNRELFNAIAAERESAALIDLQCALSPPALARLHAIRKDSAEIADPDQVLCDVIAEFEARRLLDELESLKARRASASGDELAEIIVEQQAVTARVRELGLRERS